MSLDAKKRAVARYRTKVSGVEAIIAIRTDYPDALILVMATEPSDGQIQLALAAGARGCLRKGMPMTDVLAMIRKAHANRNRRGIPARVPFAPGS